MDTTAIPTQIGRFRIVEKLGEGAMGTVYKAIDTLIQRTVAIKTIRLDVERESEKYSEVCQRFYHEARVSATLIHPNIVTLFDLGEHEGTPFLAMEFVEGKTLGRVLAENQSLSLRDLCDVMSQIAGALDFAHEKGVIHRDIKPGNIMIDGSGKIKVMDFGIAKLVDSSLTRTGTFVGTPSYISPEQASEGKVDHRSDLFSLGVLTYEMFSGDKPFQGSTIPNLLYKIVYENPSRPRNISHWGLTIQQWDKVFARALAKDPEKRFQSATELVTALRLHFLHESQTMQTMSQSRPLIDTAQLANLRAEIPMAVHQRVLEETFHKIPTTALQQPASEAPISAPHSPPLPAETAGTSSRSKAISLALLIILTGMLVFFLLRIYIPGGGGGDGIVRLVVNVESQPAGAEIFIDGKSTSLMTPMAVEVSGKRDESRRIMLRKTCYQEFSAPVILREGQQPRITSSLVPADIRVEVRTNPAGADVTVDGKQGQVTPATYHLACGANHKLAISLAGFKPAAREIDPSTVTAPLVIELEKLGEPGTLEVMATYDYEIFSGSKRLHSASGRDSFSFEPGSYRLRFVNRKILLNQTLSVNIESGKMQSVSLPGVGMIKSIGAYPENCQICFDGNDFCDSPPINKLYICEGPHTITCKWADGRTRTEAISVNPGADLGPLFFKPQ